MEVDFEIIERHENHWIIERITKKKYTYFVWVNFFSDNDLNGLDSAQERALFERLSWEAEDKMSSMIDSQFVMMKRRWVVVRSFQFGGSSLDVDGRFSMAYKFLIEPYKYPNNS